MNISYIAINRMVEEHAARDEAYRRQLRRNGKCTLSDGRSLSDQALLEKLRSLGLKAADRDWLDHVTSQAPSAQVLATALMNHGDLDVPTNQDDWLWIALVCLWERWFPDRPSCEMLDDRMQAGYEACERDQPLETARHWLQVWRGVEHLMTAFKIGSIDEFDELFGGTNSVFNWVQDYSGALHCAALSDRSFARERVHLCCAVLALAEKSEEDRSLIDGFKRDLAESHADLGEYETVDRLYGEWLRDDPRWGWGWIGWSDIYNPFTPSDHVDTARAEQILKDGLAVCDVRDRADVVDRLATLYEDTDRTAEAAALRQRRPAGIEDAVPERSSRAAFREEERPGTDDAWPPAPPGGGCRERPDRRGAARGPLGAARNHPPHRRAGRPQRPLPLRQRKEVQEVLRTGP